MSTNDTYLAVFRGSKTSPRREAWDALPESERRAREREGIAAWKAWVEKHHDAIAAMGGRRSRNAGSMTRAMTSERSRLCVRNRSQLPLECSRVIRTLRSSRATPSRSCPCCQSRALSGRQQRRAPSSRRSLPAHPASSSLDIDIPEINARKSDHA